MTRRVTKHEKKAVLRMNATKMGIVIRFGALLLLSDILNRSKRSDWEIPQSSWVSVEGHRHGIEANESVGERLKSNCERTSKD